jgi:hypothetical protein
MRSHRAPEDDYLHPVEEAENFNESRYYNWFDIATDSGGWVRMGNRPNEGSAEMTVCLYLPDGQIAFMFKRPAIDSHTSHDAGGLRFEVLEPYERHQVTYDGKVCLLVAPRQMADPRVAFQQNPFEACHIELVIEAIGLPWGGERRSNDGVDKPVITGMEAFARGHTEQHMRSRGTIRVGEREFEISDGLGLRDHSWGPRSWQSVWWYRWLTVNLGPDLGYSCAVAGTESGGRSVHGFLYDAARYGSLNLVPVRAVTLDSQYDDEWFPTTVRVTVSTDDHVYDCEGTMSASIPLRNQRGGQMTRITENATHWTCGDSSGSGMSEYLDQVIEGTPVGTIVGI